MAFHNPLDSARSHDLSWNSNSVPPARPADLETPQFAYSVDVSTVSALSFPPYSSSQYYPITESHGYASGVSGDSYLHQNYHQSQDPSSPQTRKRRKLSSSVSNCDHTMPSMNELATPAQQNQDSYRSFGGPSNSTTWSTSLRASPTEASGSCMPSWLWSSMCASTEGYVPMREQAPVMYGPDMSYESEKPLTVPHLPSESYKSEPLDPHHREAFYTDHPGPQAPGVPVISSATDQALPAINAMSMKDDSTSQHTPPDQPQALSRIVKTEALASPDQNKSMARDLLDSGSAIIMYPTLPFSTSSDGDVSHSRDGHTCSQYRAMLPSTPSNAAPPAADTIRGFHPDPRSRVTQHEVKSNTFDFMQPHQRGGKRGPFRDPGLREQTAQTRRMGSCIRCRMQRIRCEHNADDPTGECMTCLRVASSKTSRFPCLRYKITDIKLYKQGQVPGYEWTKRWSNSISDPVQEWVGNDMKTIEVSEGYSSQRLQLRVRRFQPQTGDKLERSWVYNGKKRAVEIPPYALVDMEHGKQVYLKYIRNSMNEAFAQILNEKRRRNKDNFFLYKTYFRAVEHCKDPSTSPESKELLLHVFRLWMAIRLSTKSCFIVGQESLGIDELDSTSVDSGKRPLPPVLGAQLDTILIHHIQSQLRRQVLERLEKLVSKKQLNAWMTTYLITFILLHNTSLITQHDIAYAVKHGMETKFAREDKVREYHLGANILLAHFHYCNRGIHPFSEECKDHDLRTHAGLDEAQIDFVKETRNFAKTMKDSWEKVREECQVEHDYYFISQLFEDDWHPRAVV